MRLLSITAVGAALVVAGLAAPASVEQGATEAEMRFGPQVSRPGQRVRIDVPGCAPGRHQARSAAFTGPVWLAGRTGTAELKNEIGSGTYPVRVRCGTHRATGRLTVSTERSWPSLLPGALSPQMHRATRDY